MMSVEGGSRCGGTSRSEWDEMGAVGWDADIRSGGVYVYFWPRNSPSVPDDVRVSYDWKKYRSSR